MRFALNSLAVVAPEWLVEHSEAQWVERYGHRIEESRLSRSQADCLTLAELIGDDGQKVLTAVFDPLAPGWLREIPVIQVLRRIWIQNDLSEDGQLRWREAEDIPPATQFINSPYDPEARLGKKRSTLWTGYKVHLTETCEQTLPHLITHVATTPAPRTDEAMTEVIQEELSQAELSPGEHFVDAGYGSARVLVNSEARFGMEVVGPVSVDTQWQAHCPSGIDASQFVLDWERKRAICPQGKTSSSWTPLSRKQHPDLIKIQFSTTDCGSCPCRGASCPLDEQLSATNPDGQATGAALQVAWKIQRTEPIQQRYALRAGIEATISQGVRAFDLRRSRYLGMPKTHVQHLGIAAAINQIRLVAWLDGELLAPTRVSAFERLFNAA
jgi:transposase